MNEVLKKEDSAYAGGFRKPEEAIRLISERMLTHRPRVELSLHPYFKQEHMALRPISQMAELNLDGVYPQAQTGDVAYIRTWPMADRDSEAVLTIAGNAKIWMNGEEIYAGEDLQKPLSDVKEEYEYTIVDVSMRKGKNDLLIRCTKNEHSWGLLLYIAYPRYPFRWTRDYLLSVRPTLPFDEMKGMEGFAHIGPLPADFDTRRLEETIERNEVGYRDVLQLSPGKTLRWMPRWDEKCLGSRVDFTETFGSSGGCAYALSYVQSREGENYILQLTASGSSRFCSGKNFRGSVWPENGASHCRNRKRNRDSDQASLHRFGLVDGRRRPHKRRKRNQQRSFCTGWKQWSRTLDPDRSLRNGDGKSPADSFCAGI
ncbi:MAG: hypothetical protein ACLR0F_05095 [Eisenbergiella sp.]